MNTGWSPDAALLAANARALDDGLAALRRTSEGAQVMTADAAARLIEAAGRLVLLGEAREVAARRGGVDVDDGALERAVAAALSPDALGVEALETAAIALRERASARLTAAGADEPDAPDTAHTALLAALRSAFELRDGVECRLRGAEALLGRPAALEPEQQASLLEFEALLRPEVWLLTPLNFERAVAAQWVAPALRPTLWWWTEGASVAPSALDALPAVAQLITRFPVARERLAQLVRAQELWDAAGAAQTARAAPAAVLRLGDWIRRRSAARAPDDTARRGASGETSERAVALAAAGGDEVTLVEHPDYQISWLPPTALLIDLVADRAPGALPSVRLPGGAALTAPSVAGAEERFRAELPPAALDAGAVRVVLPLAHGVVEVTLPPTDPE